MTSFPKIKVPRTITDPLYFKVKIGCPNAVHDHTIQRIIDSTILRYDLRGRDFSTYCPHCETKARVTVQAIICLAEDHNHVVNTNNHWVTVDGDLDAVFTEYIKAINTFLPLAKPPQPERSFFMKLVDWFK